MILAFKYEDPKFKSAFHRKNWLFQRPNKSFLYYCIPNENIFNSNKKHLLMLLTKIILQRVALTSFVLFSLLSCSKDADLLSEYVINTNDSQLELSLLINDSFFMEPGQTTILMDVLNNDNVSANSDVTIIETSNPINGSVTINDDNTLTYKAGTDPAPEETAPEDTVSEETTTSEDDTFTYTAEVVNEETGERTEEEATVTISVNNTEMGELLAFPGAEGFGKYTTGGRGGTVIHVTNLNDSGSGSLREALQKTGPRTVVFDVGGNINLNSILELGSTNFTTNTARENITIAGETAPFPGITLTGDNLDIYTSNVILRYISIRTNKPNSEQDALRIRNWGIGGYTQSDIIIDHVTLSHADDENLSMTGFNNTSTLTNITIQNSMLGKPEGSYNFLVGSYVYNLTIVNNYFSHTSDRNPLIGYGDNGESAEIINNIVYGFDSGATITYGSYVDLIGNVYKSFANDSPNYATNDSHDNHSSNLSEDGAVFYTDNFQLNSIEWEFIHSRLVARTKSSRVLTTSNIHTWLNNITEIEESVLPTVGNSLHRDVLDTELINDYFANTGDFSSASIPQKQSSDRPTDYDTDKDGMADNWEIAVFGDLSKTSNGDSDGNGYTNLETFLFSLTQ